MSPFKVVITDFGDPDHSLEAGVLDTSGLDIDLVRLQTRDPEELIPHVTDADALIVQWATINRKVVETMPRCKVISRYGIGVDMVDLQAAGEHGIPVANVPDFCMEEVSDSTIGFVFDLSRRTFILDRYVRSGGWGSTQALPYWPPPRLRGQILGIVGLGNIGRAVAHKASCLGLKLLGHDPYVKSEHLSELDVELVTLDDLLLRSDYVSLHCPLNDETLGLIGASQLALMKPSACLINMARGPVVVQSALYDALVNHTITAAALDVLEQEPPKPDEPLLHLDNVIITPHSSSGSTEAVVQLRRDTAQNVVDALSGKKPRSIVNCKALGWT
ncbi:MAG: C-terminal binding protein [Caldilineales bacterium]|nr:C-terminal binding protein [Caldilineales bacterium]